MNIKKTLIALSVIIVGILLVTTDLLAELRDKVVVRARGNITVLTADPTTGIQGIEIEGYSRLAIFCRDDVPTPTRIQGVETATYELWFYGPDTLWHTNNADNIVVDEANDHFGFEMHGYSRFTIKKTSGNTFYCALSVD